MTWTNERFGIRSALRPMGLLLLILVFVFQLIAPHASAAASMTNGHTHHQEMADAAANCPTHSAKLDVNARVGTDLDGKHENAVHCMPSMCCFYDTVSSSKLIAVGMLLSCTQIIDRGKAPSSNAGSTQERPPRHV